jgi:hypothetical protein
MAKKGKKSTSLGTVVLWLIGNDKGLKSTFENAGKHLKTTAKSLNSLGGDFQSVGKGFAKLGAIGVGAFTGIAAALLGCTKKYAEAEQVDKQLETVLKSTAGAAGMTMESLNGLAKELSSVTTFTGGTIKSAEAMMLSFTSIGKDVFPQALEAALDMSTFFKEDLQTSVIRLGKALNDPVAGCTALQKVGVKLTAQQKEQIAAFIATGDTAKAQGVILKELAVEFGGQARAMGATTLGQLQIFQNMLAGVSKSIGKVFKESFLDQFGTNSIQQLKKFITWIETEFSPFLTNVFKRLADKIKAQTAGAGSFLNTIKDVLNSIWEWMKANPEAIVKIGTIVAGLSALSLAFGTVLITIGTFLKLVSSSITWVLRCFTLISKVWTFFTTSVFVGVASVVALIAAVRAFAEMWGSNDWSKNSISEYVKNNFPEAQKIIDAWADRMVVLRENMKAEPGSNWVSQLADSIPGVQKKLDEFFDWIVKTALPALKEAALDYWENEFVPGWKAAWKAYEDWFLSGWKLVIDEIERYFNKKLAEAKKGFFDGLLTGATGGIAGPDAGSYDGTSASIGSSFRASVPSYGSISSRNFSSSIVFNGPLIGQATIRENADIDKLSKALATHINRQRLGRGLV